MGVKIWKMMLLTLFETSDQQGFNWDEYNVWRIAADQIKRGTLIDMKLVTYLCAL